MKDYDYWERFSETGSIIDYLNYTACTSEIVGQNIEAKGADLKSDKTHEEGGDGGSNNFDWYGTISYADWRL